MSRTLEQEERFRELLYYSNEDLARLVIQCEAQLDAVAEALAGTSAADPGKARLISMADRIRALRKEPTGLVRTYYVLDYQNITLDALKSERQVQLYLWPQPVSVPSDEGQKQKRLKLTITVEP